MCHANQEDRFPTDVYHPLPVAKQGVSQVILIFHAAVIAQNMKTIWNIPGSVVSPCSNYKYEWKQEFISNDNVGSIAMSSFRWFCDVTPYLSPQSCGTDSLPYLNEANNQRHAICLCSSQISHDIKCEFRAEHWKFQEFSALTHWIQTELNILDYVTSGSSQIMMEYSNMFTLPKLWVLYNAWVHSILYTRSLFSLRKPLSPLILNGERNFC